MYAWVTGHHILSSEPSISSRDNAQVERKVHLESMTVSACILKASSLFQCIFLEMSEFGNGFLLCPHSRMSESSAVLDLASKSTKRDVSLGGCSLNKPPFLLLYRGSAKFNKAHTFNINQVSVPYTGFGFSPDDFHERILPHVRCW